MYCQQWMWFQRSTLFQGAPRWSKSKQVSTAGKQVQASIWSLVLSQSRTRVLCHGPDCFNQSVSLLSPHSQRHDFTGEIKATVILPFCCWHSSLGAAKPLSQQKPSHREEAKQPWLGFFTPWNSLHDSAADLVATLSAHRSFTMESGFNAPLNATNSWSPCR